MATKTEMRKLFILSGGAGTRLWPLSRESFPKQFFDVTGSGSPLLIDTLKRLEGLGEVGVITTEALRLSTLGVLNRFGLRAKIVGEPAAKNTAAAVALATWLALQENPKSSVGIFPSDHSITDEANFGSVIETAFAEVEAGASVVTIGITPTYAATAYGYIELEASFQSSQGRPLKVANFLEKPNQERATALIQGEKSVWNAGIFVFSAAEMANLLVKHMPKLWSHFVQLKPDLSNISEVYAQLENQSIDYGVMEKVKNLICIPASVGWSDVGSWEEVSRVGECLGKPTELDGERNHYTGLIRDGKRVAFVGVSDLSVVDTPDALLVVKHGSGQRVKELVALLRESDPELTRNHAFEERPWGQFEVLVDNENFKTKRLKVWPGQKLSYQSHKRRSEHWVIVKGAAQVTLNDELRNLKAGEHIFIPIGAKHRIANLGSSVLEFVEVQSGTYFGEDDIIRYNDEYGRC